jgi:hypothetical protein
MKPWVNPIRLPSGGQRWGSGKSGRSRLAESQVFGDDDSAVTEYCTQEESDRAHDTHHGTSVQVS